MSGWRKKRSIMRRYDITASMYDMRYAEEQSAKIDAAMKRLKTEPHGMILDVGCGTGILFHHIADKADAILGIDFSNKTLLKARERIHNEGLVNLDLVQADADNMPLCSSVFNKVFAVTTLQNTPSPARTLVEIKRVARDNAVFVITGLKKVFTKQAFEQLLKNSQLDSLTIEDENLKCYVAVCKNSPTANPPAS